MDPLVGVTGQPFAFAWDDPVNGSDPSGLDDPEVPASGPGGIPDSVDQQQIVDATEQMEHGGASLLNQSAEQDLNAQQAAQCGISDRISRQSQAEHIQGDPNHVHGGYLLSQEDAQQVLDDFHLGTAPILGTTRNGLIIVRDPDVLGYNVSPGAGYPNQETHTFLIKGSTKVSIVPTTPGRTS